MKEEGPKDQNVDHAERARKEREKETSKSPISSAIKVSEKYSFFGL